MLPTNKSLVHRSTEVAKRLFFNTYPRVKLDILHDVFSRFGDLIDASYVRGKIRFMLHRIIMNSNNNDLFPGVT